MDFLTLYARYLDQGYSEVAATRLADDGGYTDECDYYDNQEGWWFD